MIGRPPAPPEQRFWAKVRKTDSCWEWTGALYHGYGAFSLKGKFPRAHRYSWELHNGPVATGLLVLHRCDNRRCVNPAHLFLGTHQENMADMLAKGRGAPQAGEKNPSAKLSDADVRAIRLSPKPGNAVAAQFGISNSLASMIRRRLRWAHVSESAD